MVHWAELKLILKNHMKLSQVKTDKAIWKKMKNERIFALELIAVI